MLRSTAAVAVLALFAHCGSPRPDTTVPAPVGVAATEPAAAAGDAVSPPQPTLKLPRNFVPTGYRARLVIDPRAPAFDGEIAIAGDISQRSAVIWLHGYKLAVSRATAVQGTTRIDIAVAAKGEDLLELRPATPLAPGAWSLELAYRGELDAVNTSGAFRQTVGEHAYVYTQLEALYARRVFPCLDEPDNKVPWQLTLDVPKGLLAVANTPELSRGAAPGGGQRFAFAQSKPLPSYLVAFAVGPFEIVDGGKSKRGTPVRVIALAGRAADAAYAAQTSAKVLDLTEDWFGTPYPYEKLDQIAIPLTVGFGAMENAGLITYTETLILMDPTKASKERQRSWITVAAHEIAHQWFGNLVTAQFWDDIWLNEGFASWLQHKTTYAFEPAWRDDQSTLSTRMGALSSDGLLSARQIRQPIESVDDIFNAFDGITYSKGASVLAMFEAYLGPEVFQRGVRDYLASRAWGSATSNDFVTALSKSSGVDVTAAVTTFLEQPGAPELTATLGCQGGKGGKGGKAELALSQRRYLPPGSPRPAQAAQWQFPVCVAYDKGNGRGEACTLLTAATGTLALPSGSCPRWVLPNKEGRGYYRSALTVAQVTALRDEAWSKLSWTERRALFFDVSEAAMTGALPLSLAMSLVPRLLAGGDRFTMAAAMSISHELERHVPRELQPKFEAWLRATYGAAAAKTGITGKPGDSLDTESTRGRLLGTVAFRGRDPKLVAESVKLAPRWRELPQSVGALVLAIAADASPPVFDRTLREVTSEPNRQRRREMYTALGGNRDPAQLARAFALLLDPKVDIRETLQLLFVPGTEPGRAAAADFFRTHADAILARVPRAETSGPIARMSGLFTQACRADQREAVTAYVKQHFASLPGGPRVVAQNLEEMDQCIAQRAILAPAITAWLQGAKLK